MAGFKVLVAIVDKSKHPFYENQIPEPILLNSTYRHVLKVAFFSPSLEHAQE